MAERSTSSFRRLFEVRLLHHYWLDEGGKIFDALPADKQAARLLDYDARRIFAVAPTAASAGAIAGLGGVFLTTGQGFAAAAPAGANIAADTEFSFVVTIVDPAFHHYTAMTFRARPVVAAFDPSDNTPQRSLYRYKTDAPVLSNLTGAVHSINGAPQLFLSRDYAAATGDERVEDLVLSGAALAQLTSDNPGAATRPLGATAADLPVFLNRNDAPAVAPPPGVVGAPARGLLLADDLPDELFALIRLTARRADDDAFSFVDAGGAPRDPAPVYQVRFRNRSTLWTYLDKATGATLVSEAAPLPLTNFGNAGSRQKPSRGEIKALVAGGKITQLVSEIYI